MANVAQLQEHPLWTKAGPLPGHGSEASLAALEEQAMATVADPVPFGLWAFATGTWMAGTVFGGAIPASALPGLAPVLVLFAGIGQFIAGLFAFRRANSLAATAFCCFGAFNATAGAMLLATDVGHIAPAGSYEPVFMGFLLESFAFIAVALTFAALRTNLGLVSVLGLLAIGYCLTGIPQLADAVGQGGWGTVGNIGGWFLCASSFAAAYTGMALVVNSTWQRQVLPLGGAP